MLTQRILNECHMIHLSLVNVTTCPPSLGKVVVWFVGVFWIFNLNELKSYESLFFFTIESFSLMELIDKLFHFWTTFKLKSNKEEKYLDGGTWSKIFYIYQCRIHEFNFWYLIVEWDICVYTPFLQSLPLFDNAVIWQCRYLTKKL